VPAPFADRERRGFFAALFETWKLACTEPQRFFANVRVDQLGPAILFAVLTGSIGLVAAGGYDWLMGPSFMNAMRQAQQTAGGADGRQVFELLMSGTFTVIRIVSAPLLILLALYVGAGIVHLGMMMLGGAAGGFKATLTVVAYSFAPWILGAVPFCGSLAGMIWQLVILIIGLAAVHRTETWKSAVTVIASAVLGCCCSCCLGTMLMGMSMEAFKHGGSSGVSNL
jgi:hypothetical protein